MLNAPLPALARSRPRALPAGLSAPLRQRREHHLRKYLFAAIFRSQLFKI